jgi:4-amino-4-deoxy-L-arabinose transferase-like glycosyltransferase
MTRTRTDALLIAGFCAFLFFYGLGPFGLVGADEPRYAQVAREMLDRHDWITPVMDGQPWLEKPPLYYWQTMLSYSLFGVSDWAARVPSAFDATLMVLAIYLFFRRFRQGIELDAALIVASCAGVIGYSRAASMDMALAAAFTIAMLAWWSWRESGERKYLAVFYASLGLGTLAKGPVAPILAVLVIALCTAVLREWRLLLKTFWLPGILLFCAVSLPWYLAVQMRNPEFFRVFILEHNLGRFAEDLYHHREHFWYYLPVTALGLIPWTVFVIVAGFHSARAWWSEQRVEAAGQSDLGVQFAVFSAIWLAVPVLFFSFSQSKLPGYILPALPAGAVLLADYLRQRLQSEKTVPVPAWLASIHALVATAAFVPALLISGLLLGHRLPAGKPLYFALGMALVITAGIALTLVSKLGLRMLRFVTLIPVILTIGAVLKLGSADLDEALSARPLARQIASMETRSLPLAVYKVPREVEYGLTFYRNRLTERYEWGRVPSEEHLLVAPENSQADVRRQTLGRRVVLLGHYAPQHLDYFWVAAEPGVKAN